MAPPPPHAASAPLRSGRTGDLDGNLNRVKRELRRIRFPVDFDGGAARQGSPMALLPALHYAMLGFSRHVTSSLSEAGHDLRAKSDARFVENAWRALREEFGYNPALTPQQFLSPGFAERKLMLLFDAIELCKRRHNEHARAQRGREAAAAVARDGIPRVAREAAARSAADATTNDEPAERRVPIRVERAPRTASARTDAKIAAARANANAEANAKAVDAARDSDDSDGDFEFRPSPGRAPLADVVVPPEEAAERAWFASASASASVSASPSASSRLGGSGGRLGGGGAVVPPSPPRIRAPGSGLVAEDDERPGIRTDALRDGLRRSGGFADENAAPRGEDEDVARVASAPNAAPNAAADAFAFAGAVAAAERRAAEAESRAAAAVDLARFAEVRAGEAADVAAAAAAECDDARRKIAALSSALAEQTAKTMLLEGRVRMLEEGAERAAVGYVASAGVRASRERERLRASGGRLPQSARAGDDANSTRGAATANERKKDSASAPAFVDVAVEAEDAVGARDASGSRGDTNSAYSSYYGNLSRRAWD